MLNFSSYFIEEELKKRGFQVKSFYDNDLLMIERDGKRMFTHSSITKQETSSYLICRDKYLSKQVLSHFHFPTAKGVLLSRDNPEDILDLSFPLALKPANLSGGTDVSLGIQSTEEIREYFRLHPNYSHVLAEEMLSGEDVRILIIRGKFFAACRREPPTIEGNGQDSIQKIIEDINIIRERELLEQQQSGSWTKDILPILFDHESTKWIQKQGYDLTDILPIGKKIVVRPNSNQSTGGSTRDVTDEVCPNIQELCEQVAQSIHMSTIGIDLMCESLSRPLSEQVKAGIVEINASPGLSIHILTHVGTRRNPAPLIVDEIEENLV